MEGGGGDRQRWERKWVHVVNISFKDKLSPPVTGALAEILYKYR